MIGSKLGFKNGPMSNAKVEKVRRDTLRERVTWINTDKSHLAAPSSLVTTYMQKMRSERKKLMHVELRR